MKESLLIEYAAYLTEQHSSSFSLGNFVWNTCIPVNPKVIACFSFAFEQDFAPCREILAGSS
jgi:hypothetical protein